MNIDLNKSLFNMTLGDLKDVIKSVLDERAADDAVKASVDECTLQLGDDGRVLLRKSGTEPVLRVMSEAETLEDCVKQVDHIIESMKQSGHLIEIKK